jgi:predicted lipid carrier protein YhbT
MSGVFHLPGFIAVAIRPLPLPPLELALQRLTSNLVARYPELLERLEAAGSRRCAIDPTDLPMVIVLEPRGRTIGVRVVRNFKQGIAEAHISGPLQALLGLVNGTYDGDALFFSRDLNIEGEIETILAFRNAIDDAEIDLLAEALAPAGIFAEALTRTMRTLGEFLRRRPATANTTL